MRLNHTIQVAALALAGCASTATSDATDAHAKLAVGPEGAASAPSRPESVQLDEDRLDGAELAIWNDPRFKKRFIDSYVADSEVEPGLTSIELPRMQQILDLIAADKVDRAIGVLQRNLGPASSAVFDFTLGNIYFQREELFQASDSYRSAVAKYPKFRRAWRNLGLVHVRRTDYSDAATALSRVIELGGGDAVTYGLLGFCYSSTENHISAESAYRMALLLDPESKEWPMWLAKCFVKQERYADSAALCNQLLAADPERADLWLLQANSYLGLGQPMRAAENFEIVERLGGSTPQSLALLGDIYINEDLFDLGVEAYRSALARFSEESLERAIRAAKVMAARGALEETSSLVAEIEGGAGEDLAVDVRKDLLRLRARIASVEGAGEEEGRVLAEIVELDPLDGEALIKLGQLLGRNGDVARAVLHFERAANLEAFEADARVRHAQLLVSEGRFGEALPLLRRAQAVNPRDDIQRFLEQVERSSAARGAQ